MGYLLPIGNPLLLNDPYMHGWLVCHQSGWPWPD